MPNALDLPETVTVTPASLKFPSASKSKVCAAPLLPSQIECFHRHRFAVIPDWLPAGTISRLKEDAQELDAEGLAVASLVGNGAGQNVNENSRGREVRCVKRDPAKRAHTTSHKGPWSAERRGRLKAMIALTRH